MISQQKGFLFVHVPKTGGNSIQNVLARYSEDSIVIEQPHQDGQERFGLRSAVHPDLKKHSRLSQYRLALGPQRLERLYKFAVARNPWDRAVSYYFSPHRGGKRWDREAFVRLIGSIRPLAEYISLQPGRPLGADLDCLLRYEHLAADFAQVCAVIGIPPEPLPRRNVSVREHYSTYYDDELREIVAERFREEIEQLGYSFDRA